MASVREWDEQSYRSEHTSRPVTIRRYKISDAGDKGNSESDRWEASSRVSRREPESRARSRSRTTTREFRFERRESRSPSPEIRQIRIERDISRDPPRRRERERERERDDYELDHYTRSTEYFERERPERERHRDAQTIIIKNEAPSPIIIRERENVEGRELARVESPAPVEEKKEDLLEVATTRSHRSASVDERQLERRDPSPEEDYYYQRTTRQIQRRQPQDDYDDYRRQRQRPRDADNYSDDEVFYRRTEYTDPNEHTVHDPNHRRHLAEGALVGLGAAALLNRDKKKKGEKSGGAGQLIGGAAVGAVGTELVSRARQYWDRERSRSRDREYGGNRGRRYDSPERARSHSRGHDLAKLGAMAAIGAIAGYAASRKGGKDKHERRSRSRRRRHSHGRSRSRSSSSGGTSSAKKRNNTIAGAGLASAAVAGLVERARSKSRPGRSKSRIRTGLPIAAAGLGGAALAGLYENNKAKKAKARSRTRGRSRSVSPSRSRSRSRSVARSEQSRGAPADDGHLIEYGGDPIPPSESRLRSRSRADSFYSNYGGRRGSPSSAESSPRRHGHGRGHGHRDSEEAVAGPGIAGVAAHEASKRRERKRAERERRRQEEDGSDLPQQPQPQQVVEGYGFGPYAQQPPPQTAVPVGSMAPQQNQFYPQPNNFAPPPQPPNQYSPVPNFTGQQQPQQPPPSQDYDNNYGQYPPPNPHVSEASPLPEPSRPSSSGSSQGVDETATVRRPRLTRSLSSGDLSPRTSVSRSRRVSRVHFDLDPHTRDAAHAPGIYRAQSIGGISTIGRDSQQRDKASNGKRRHVRERSQHYSSSSPPASDDSGETIILPDRFDRHGRKKPERGDDPIADAVQDTLKGRNRPGRLLRQLLGDLGRSRSSQDVWPGSQHRRSRSE